MIAGEQGSSKSTNDATGFWVIGDDANLSETVQRVVAGSGTLVRFLPRLPDPIEEDPPVSPDWLLADLGAKGFSSEKLEAFKKHHPSCQLFLVAGNPKAPVPVALARLGVRQWFLRPLDPSTLRRVFKAALRSRRAEMERIRVRRDELPDFNRLIGRSPPFLEVCDLARRAAKSPSTVILIEGETGTGKGVFSKAIHRESPRAKGPYVEVNCPSLPGSLLESELFGHEKGAFTHAQSAKPGLLELADSGTFLLDEIGETLPQVQAKVLKFLDDGHYRRVGGIEEREVDVRILAATQKDLEEEVRNRRFRGDLFHRIHVVRIRIPPLRDRDGDTRLLLHHYLGRFAARQGRRDLTWSEPALRKLEKHPWPGNVRELVNLCERTVLMAQNKKEILPEDLPEAFSESATFRAVRDENQLRVEIPNGVSFDEIERAVLERALGHHGGNVSRAAASLGMGRGQLRYRMARLQMTVQKSGRMRERLAF